MKRPSKADIGNMDWQMRNHGYAADARPTAEDVQRIVGQMPMARFTESQLTTFLESADFAYSMKLRHRAQGGRA